MRDPEATRAVERDLVLDGRVGGAQPGHGQDVGRAQLVDRRTRQKDRIDAAGIADADRSALPQNRTEPLELVVHQDGPRLASGHTILPQEATAPVSTLQDGMG